MDFAAIIDGIESFAAYVGELASVIGHVGRVVLAAARIRSFPAQGERRAVPQ